MSKAMRTVGIMLSVATVVWLIGGCRRDQPKRKYIEPIEGKAVDINPQTNEVSMELVHPETGLVVRRNGFVTAATKVDINGVTARIEDVQRGDIVKVGGYQEGPRESRRFYVTSISVRRSNNDWVDIDAAGHAPASRAAE